MIEKDAQHQPPLLRIWMLGNFYVERWSVGSEQWEPISPSAWKGSNHPRDLLKVLLCFSKRRAQRSAIVDKLWPDVDPGLGENYLSNAAYKLRHVLKGHEYLLKTFGDHGDSGYELADQSLLWVDADACDALMAKAESVGRTSASALPLLQEAIRYFERGKFLQSEDGLWCYSRRGMLDRLYYRCRIWLAEAYEQQGIVGLAETQYNKLLEEDPADEDVLFRLMRLHYQQGMTHLALRCYEDVKRQLKEEGQKLSSAVNDFAEKLRSNQLQPEMQLVYKAAIIPNFSSADNRSVYQLGSQDMHSILRRQFLQQIFGVAGTALLPQGLAPWGGADDDPVTGSGVEGFVSQCETSIMTCWRLMKGSEIFAVRSLLTTWLPTLDLLIEQSSKHQKMLARLGAQGYILAGLVAVLQRRYDGAEWCCKHAVEYSHLAEDNDLLVASLKHLATKYNSANYPLLTLNTYQEALPLVNQVSPLLRSRTYLGLALSYAQCKQKPEADHYLGLAQDTFPERPEDDPSFLYADCGRPSLNHYGGLIHLEFGESQKAWQTFADVEVLASKTVVPERTLIEIVNCQAEAAVDQGDMEMAYAHVQTGLAGAQKLNSEKRFYDTRSVYRKMCVVWPHEPKVKQLEELFHREVKSK